MALYAFDGTKDRWDPTTPITLTAKTKNNRYLTNVVIFYDVYRKSGIPAEYFPGVGSSRNPLDQFFGLNFGLGARGIVNRAFQKLQANYRQGDTTIDIVGYSRGAAIARMFADRVFKYYEKLIDPSGNVLTAPPPIRFMGLWDTVASFGNPLNDYELFFQEHIPSSVSFAVHAMALDMKQLGFGLDRAYGDNVLEVWFRGGHGDIGGNSQLKTGEPNRLRTNITLNFMVRKAIAAGVPLAVNFGDYPVAFEAPIVIENNNIKQDYSRNPRKYDIFHHSLFDAEGNTILFPDAVDLPGRTQLVIEEVENETQLSEPRLIQLTPALSEKYPDTRAIYDKLYQ